MAYSLYYCVYTHASVYSTATLNTHYIIPKNMNTKVYMQKVQSLLPRLATVRGARALHGWWRVLIPFPIPVT